MLIEPKQLKQLDSKFTQSTEMKYAFNDGESWIQVKIIDKEAIGAVKVRYIPNIAIIKDLQLAIVIIYTVGGKMCIHRR